MHLFLLSCPKELKTHFWFRLNVISRKLNCLGGKMHEGCQGGIGRKIALKSIKWFPFAFNPCDEQQTALGVVFFLLNGDLVEWGRQQTWGLSRLDNCLISIGINWNLNGLPYRSTSLLSFLKRKSDSRAL